STVLFKEMTVRLRDLGTPEGDRRSHAEFIRAAEQFAYAETRLRNAIESGDAGALNAAATEAAAALAKFRAQAALYGFEECSKNATTGG
ncbi:MAG TPA: hypothetical protein VFG58_09845, partial [Solirubrobacterales bacterium]|nr:hypothetical protein [Solirubrobacterales bacterium]